MKRKKRNVKKIKAIKKIFISNNNDGVKELDNKNFSNLFSKSNLFNITTSDPHSITKYKTIIIFHANYTEDFFMKAYKNYI